MVQPVCASVLPSPGPGSDKSGFPIVQALRADWLCASPAAAASKSGSGKRGMRQSRGKVGEEENSLKGLVVLPAM